MTECVKCMKKIKDKVLTLVIMSFVGMYIPRVVKNTIVLYVGSI